MGMTRRGRSGSSLDGTGGRRVNASENLRELTASEQAFVDTLCAPPFPTVADAGEAAGYGRAYAYKLHNLPHIQDAIAQRCAELERDNQRKAQAVLSALAERGLKERGDEAAKIFLQAIGRVGGGVTVVNNVSATAGGESIEDTLEAVRERRANRLVTSDN
jgi:hypothetical protein